MTQRGQMMYLITYDFPHRKTQDLLYRFKLAGVDDLHVLASPWVERKNFVPLYKTKLDPQPWYPERVAKQLGYKFNRIESEDTSCLNGQLVVIAGAGLLSEYFVESNTVINAHCGFLPEVRGLDALKWAIYYDQPIGVTTHIVNGTCDGGYMIERREVPLYPQDSLFSIAVRQYEMELDMLVDAVVCEKYRETSEFSGPNFDIGRRMPYSKELQMIKRLDQRLANLNA